jgi:hypothetical protein
MPGDSPQVVPEESKAMKAYASMLLVASLCGCTHREAPIVPKMIQTVPQPPRIVPKAPKGSVAKSLWKDPVIVTNNPMVHLGWKPSPSAGVSGYYMCWGLESGRTTNRLDSGNVTNVFLGSLNPGYTYYFTVVAYSAYGDEAPPSNEVNWTVTEEKKKIVTVTQWSSNLVDWIEVRRSTNDLTGEAGFWRLKIE